MEIQTLRRQIDVVDDQILHLLSERVKLCKTIGAIKKESEFSIKDHYRENEVYGHVRGKAAELGLDPIRVEAIYSEIIAMCTNVQKEI
ncbi:MAG: chorismate mutase [Candidatus Bathyarchaeia archaeon]